MVPKTRPTQTKSYTLFFQSKKITYPQHLPLSKEPIFSVSKARLSRDFYLTCKTYYVLALIYTKIKILMIFSSGKNCKPSLQLDR